MYIYKINISLDGIHEIWIEVREEEGEGNEEEELQAISTTEGQEIITLAQYQRDLMDFTSKL